MPYLYASEVQVYIPRAILLGHADVPLLGVTEAGARKALPAAGSSARQRDGNGTDAGRSVRL